MRSLRRRGVLLLAVSALVIASAAFANVFLLDFYGYDYWNPFTPPPNTPGNCYNALGYVPSANATYLNFDYGLNEYTFHFYGACFVNEQTVGTRVIWNFSGGSFDVYCDSLSTGTAADYGTGTPPNATAPSTFVDGDCVLGGDFSGLQIVVDLITGDASLYGSMTLVRGSQLGNIPVDQRSGWTLAGLRANAPGTPEGYFWQIDGQLFIEEPTAIEEGSWGSLKNRFMGGE